MNEYESSRAFIFTDLHTCSIKESREAAMQLVLENVVQRVDTVVPVKYFVRVISYQMPFLFAISQR